MKTRFLLIGSMAFVAMVSLVSAQDAAGAPDPAKPCPAFKKLDKDGDGAVSKDEFLASAKDDAQKAKMEKRFAKLDKDGDSKLTPAEMNAGKSAKPKKDGQSAEPKKDGKGKAKGPKPQ
jgi:Ca2+-binding EF-hand superfamily protein